MFKGSWKTTAAGVATGIALIAQQVANLLDSDPTTVFEFGIVVAGLTAMGFGFFARDNGVTSEQAGAKS